jgi:hypothetical protein
MHQCPDLSIACIPVTVETGALRYRDLAGLEPVRCVMQ